MAGKVGGAEQAPQAAPVAKAGFFANNWGKMVTALVVGIIAVVGAIYFPAVTVFGLAGVARLVLAGVIGILLGGAGAVAWNLVFAKKEAAKEETKEEATKEKEEVVAKKEEKKEEVAATGTDGAVPAAKEAGK